MPALIQYWVKSQVQVYYWTPSTTSKPLEIAPRTLASDRVSWTIIAYFCWRLIIRALDKGNYSDWLLNFYKFLECRTLYYWGFISRNRLLLKVDDFSKQILSIPCKKARGTIWYRSLEFNSLLRTIDFGVKLTSLATLHANPLQMSLLFFIATKLLISTSLFLRLRHFIYRGI